ncbi:hypothetical protein [Bradyrhizobium sp. Ce-3]|uniref:hypothetical protein n=1 Tax=Bradyrhizobium sp. Ce-3 TaxID=2913970 RepID=UPI001FBB0CCB|nr:hypothetical protein [Bradyrhizobium sp. Ce-3]GKQ49167.1 hypothetical protein BRSPCE3_00210 [Bradyrhizobium sp. Ce-3]
MIGMRHIAAGVVALAMLTTSAMARDVPPAGPSGFARAHSASHWSGGPPRMAAPRFGDTEALPRDQPGGVCDSGDNAMIC